VSTIKSVSVDSKSEVSKSSLGIRKGNDSFGESKKMILQKRKVHGLVERGLDFIVVRSMN
jgi:hypothetical protein